MNHPFAHKPPRAKRSEPRRVSGRVRLSWNDYHVLRTQAYQRSGGLCECGCGKLARDDVRRPHPEAGEFAHNEHGARKSDELNRGRWLNWQCHENSHNSGGKPVPRKPGRVMGLRDGEKYWRGKICYCAGPKKSQETFCPTCRLELSPQTAEDIENTTGRVWCESVARAELEILAAQRVESTG